MHLTGVREFTVEIPTESNQWFGGKASASRVADLGSILVFAVHIFYQIESC